MLARIPWSPPVKVDPKPKPKRMNKDRRRHLVTTAAKVMREARDAGHVPTLLNLEGPIRTGLRSRLCLLGWSWSDADAVATDIVATALRQIGAKRPDWMEGQPEWSQQGAGALIERTRCIRCGSPLEGIQRKFCSDLCGSAYHYRLSAIGAKVDGDAYSYVTRALRWKHEA